MFGKLKVLVMGTNARRKFINEKGLVEGYGEVWFDKQAISNLFSLSDAGLSD